jgi:hypothetical protein
MCYAKPSRFLKPERFLSRRKLLDIAYSRLSILAGTTKRQTKFISGQTAFVAPVLRPALREKLSGVMKIT